MTTKAKATPKKEKVVKSKAMIDGIKAIIYLQSMAGIVETPAQAAKGWIALGKSGQRSTMNAYRIMKS